VIDQARQRTAELAGLHRLLRGAGHALLPLRAQLLALGIDSGGGCGAPPRLIGFVLPASVPLPLPLVCWIAAAVMLWRRFAVVAALLPALGIVVGVMVERLLVGASLMHGIDLLGGHALEFVEQQRAGRRAQTVGDQQRVDGVSQARSQRCLTRCAGGRNARARSAAPRAPARTARGRG
jgi:hypothetical protein